MVNSHKALYRCINCIVGRLYDSTCLLLIIFMQIFDTLIHIFFICFLKVVSVSKMFIYFHIFSKSSIGFALSNCLNVKKKPLECKIHNTAYNWAFTNNHVYSIQHTRYKVVWIVHLIPMKLVFHYIALILSLRFYH